MNINFKIIAHGTTEYNVVIALRQEVLRTPLGLVFSTEELEKEKDYIHIIGLQNNEIIATASLVKEQFACKMRQVAVKENMQGSGVGSNLMSFCEKYAKMLEMKSIYCHAREVAVPFYLKNGYVSEGDYFTEVDIPHVKMRKWL